MAYHPGVDPIPSGAKISASWMEYVEDSIDTLNAGSILENDTYMIFYDPDTALYKARNGKTAAIDFQGAVLLNVANATIAAIAEGVIYFRDLTIPNVTEKDGVILISNNDGIYNHRFTNPITETASQTNTQNVIMFNILSQPINDPTLDAWSAFTSEIIGKTGLTKYLVAGYFAAKAPTGSNQYLWALNPLITLDAGSLGNGICVEVDVNNNQADDIGEGVTITGLSNFNPYVAIAIQREGASRWNRGIFLQDIRDYAVIFNQDVADTFGFLVNVDDGLNSSYPFSLFYNNQLTWNVGMIAGVTTMYIRNRGASGDALLYYNANDAEPQMRLSYGGLSFGAGGASPTDCEISRAIANLLQLGIDDGLLAIGSVDTSMLYGAEVTGDTVWRLSIAANGTIWWGPGNAASDINLYRNAANQLATDDQFMATDGLVTKAKAGTFTDADFVVPTIGLLAVDVTNNRVYFRTGAATWHYCTADGGFTIPPEEKNCPICHERIKKGDFVCGQINEKMSDGALHGVYVHLKCAVK